MVKIEGSISIGTVYKILDFPLFSIQMPSDWEARYGVDNPNLVFFRLPKDVLNNSTSPNSFSVQFLDRSEVIILEAQDYADAEASFNPGGKTSASKLDFNGLPGVIALTEDLPFKLDNGEAKCNVWTAYFQNPKNLKLFRLSFWYDITKKKKYAPIFEHMLKSFKMK